MTDSNVTTPRDFNAELYNAVGQLTRELHNTLKSIDIGTHNSAMPTAKNRLAYVLSLTEEAANKTMDGIEKIIPISNALAVDAKGLHKEWVRFEKREMAADEFRELYVSMMNFLQRVGDSSESIHNYSQEIFVAQNYQDLTGQAIKKVIDAVSDVEMRLAKLVTLAAEAGKMTGVKVEAEEAEVQSNINKANSVVSGQDEVDDLLSSIGF